MKLSKVLWFLSCGLISLCALSCAHKRQDPFVNTPGRLVPIESSVLVLIENFLKARQTFDSVSGIAKGVVWEGKSKRPFKQFFALSFPGKLRLDIQNSIGQTMALLISDGQSLFFRQKNMEDPVFSDADSKGIEDALGYALSVAELISVLTIQTPDLPLKEGQLSMRSGNFAVISSERTSGHIDFYFDVKTGVLKKINFFNLEGELQVAIFYENYTLVEGKIFPYRLLIRSFKSKNTVEWNLVKIHFAPNLKPDTFRVPNEW